MAAAHSGTNLIYTDSFKFRAIFALKPSLVVGTISIILLNNLQAISETQTVVENVITEIRVSGNDHTYDSNNIFKPNVTISSVLDTAVIQSISGPETGTFYVVLNPLVSSEKIILNSTHLPFIIPFNVALDYHNRGDYSMNRH